jgi:hypothetical protein
MVVSSSSSPELRSVLASIYLQCGNLGAASIHLDLLQSNEMVEPDLKTSNAILKAVFMGDWEGAVRLLRARIGAESSREKHMQRVMVGSFDF